MIVTFFWFEDVKKVQNWIFGCLMDGKKKFLGTLYTILYKFKWTDFWGQIEPTYLQNG